MGSGGSKDAAFAAGGGGVSGGGGRGRRSLGARVLGAACLGSPSVLSDEQPGQDNGRSKNNTCTDEGLYKTNQGSREGCRKFRVTRPGQVTSSDSSRVVVDEEGQESTSHADSGASSSATTQTASFTRSSNSFSRSRSRLGFIADGIGFRLRRAASLGSSGAHSLLSAVRADGGDHVDSASNGSSDDRNDRHQDGIIVDNVPSQDTVRSITNTEPGVSGHSQHIPVGTENFETRRPTRRFGLQEPLEGSIRFSRTLSVGRLRDRVLRRTSFSDGLFDPVLLEDRSTGYTVQGNERLALGGAIRVDSSSERNVDTLPSSSSNHPIGMSSSTDRTRDYEPATPQLREGSNRDILEHRSAFLERRRRIRSQVRALQRLGSRFENLPGHDRSCILSGQHRTGRCTCRTSNRSANPDDETNTRSSISRIVMLAEALFEVLDEIHQQAVVLASQPSVSSTGSIPAPKEVVECMPVKIYGKPQKFLNEEAAQCYICLVEYEEGDCVRILPCHHEFHRTCVDKWLKEIHRVCPLCRGDVCRSDVSSMEKLS